jgi:hypothetical protein
LCSTRSPQFLPHGLAYFPCRLCKHLLTHTSWWPLDLFIVDFVIAADLDTQNINELLRAASPAVLSMWRCKNVAGAKCKPLLLSLKLTLQIGGRLLISKPAGSIRERSSDHIYYTPLASAKCKPLLLSLELTLQIGRRLLIANHLESSERGSSSSQIVFVTLFSSRYKALVRLLPASAQCADMLGQKHFAEPNWHVLTSLHPILMSSVTEHCWGFL